jgi:hypothetical protein
MSSTPEPPVGQDRPFARDGVGVLPGGRVHPDVERAIARTQDSGTPLDRDVRVQQRGASTSGPLTVTGPGDALEAEADAPARALP